MFIVQVLFIFFIEAFCVDNFKPSQEIFAQSGPTVIPIATTIPNLPGGVIANDAPPGPFFQDFKGPFPTDSWWSGLTVKDQNAVVAGPFPYQSATTDVGLSFGMGDAREFDGTSIKVLTQRDWTATIDNLPQNIDNRKAIRWDTQTVCLQYFNGKGGTMDTCLVPGSPYITLEFQNATVILTSTFGNIVSFEWVANGTKARVINGGGTYLIYVLKGRLVFTVGTKKLTSSPGFSGTLRMVKLKEITSEAILDAHSNTYPIGHKMSYTVSGDTSTQIWQWSVVGDPTNLLMLCWPHHRKTLVAPKYVDIEYLTLKGTMKGVVGDTWTLQNDLPTIDFFAATKPHDSCITELDKTVEADVNDLKVMVPGDFYFWGGAFGRASRLALIAEHVGRIDLIDKVISILKESVEYWFDAGRFPVAAYETGWGGFINKQGWNNTWVDFGNAYYNDHHFHYGYLLQGAATIGKYDPEWLSENIEFFTHVARDIGNPSPNDPHYTVTRHMDFFAGHSWASGIANGAGGRDQESSSEAINGYYGLLLFAKSTNNQALVDWSRIILAMEILASQTYWHLYQNDHLDFNPYPEQAFRELTTVGNVMDTQAGAWLFWGAQRIQIAAIQILPLTPIGQITYDKEWMEVVLPYCENELKNDTFGDDFKSVIYAAFAKVDPQKAYEYSSQLFEWGSGNSASNQLYFVATQPSSKNICNVAQQTPEGVYAIQDVTTGRFISVAGNGHLVAIADIDVVATKFLLTFKPGGGTIKSISSNKFVTGSPDGMQPLAAARDVALGYEMFRWNRRSNNSYELIAMVNRAKVIVQPGSGKLINPKGNTGGDKFILHSSDVYLPPPIVTSGVLKGVNSKFIVSTIANPTLKAETNTIENATQWIFERVDGSPDIEPQYTIRNGESNMYVTANMEGNVPLAASARSPREWEYFQIIAYNGAYVIRHVVNGQIVALRSDGILIDNKISIDDNTLWEIY